ncbi:MAG: hypothetical protein P9L94_12995 [Candidatus Hinthialibacter antarcticus]|nr:hypothetical protein [Candidatus Hinthialibacter antarcticus]
MDIAALSSAMAAQSIMGELLVRTLDQTQAIIVGSGQLELSASADKIAASIDGLGENLDVTA